MKSSNGQILESPLLAVGRRYVFYQSLFSEPSSKYQELGKYASTQISNFSASLGMSGENQGGQQIMQAINFLQNSADFERQKELNFFKHYETAYPEIKKLFDINPEDILNDYPTFITNINRAIKGTDTLKKELHSEIDRIKKNRELSDDVYNKSQNKKSKELYAEDIARDHGQISMNNDRFFMKASGEAAFESAFFNNHGNMSDLGRLIVEKYGISLFSWSGTGGLKLNAKQKDALLAAVIMKANELFVSNFQFKGTKEEKLKSVIEDPALQKFINNLLSSPDLISAITSIAQQYNIKDDDYTKVKESTQSVNKITIALMRNYQQLEKEGKVTQDFASWQKENGMTNKDIRQMIINAKTIKALTYYTGEDLSMLDLVNSHIRAVLGGGKNPTDDIEAGALITTLQYDPKSIEQLESQLWESQRKHFQRIGATSTYESFLKNTQELIDARTEQKKNIDKFFSNIENGQAGIKEMLSHINIHSTVKGYESAGSYTFEKEGGFGGAAFGSTLDSELKIIDSMAQAGGLDPLDIDNLFIAMINCGQLMIGEPLKHTIENYFSAFMGMLMFNDAQLFASDVKAWLQDKTELSTVQDLHLYQLNGIIVPSSYILQETYNAMSKLQVMDAQYRGVRATLKTDNAKPITGDWEGTSKRAIEKTKLERMHFLAGFIDLLEDIESRLNNL